MATGGVFAARRAALLAFYFCLSSSAALAGQGVEVVDFSNVSLLRLAASTNYATTYDVIRNPSYLLQLVRRLPGTKSPPFQHRGAFFAYFLNDGAALANYHPGGDGVQKFEAGRVDLQSEGAAGAGATITSAQPLDRLVVYSPPFEDAPATPNDLVSTAMESLKQNPPGQTSVPTSENVRARLGRANLGAKPFLLIPLFSGNNSRGTIRPSLVVMAQPHSWAGSQRQEVLWIPVDGRARVAFDGQNAIIKAGAVLRIPAGYASKVAVAPEGGRFAAIVLGINGL